MTIDETLGLIPVMAKKIDALEERVMSLVRVIEKQISQAPDEIWGMARVREYLGGADRETIVRHAKQCGLVGTNITGHWKFRRSDVIRFYEATDAGREIAAKLRNRSAA